MELLDYAGHDSFVSLRNRGKYFTVVMESIKTTDGYITLDGRLTPFRTYSVEFPRDMETLTSQTFDND